MNTSKNTWFEQPFVLLEDLKMLQSLLSCFTSGNDFISSDLINSVPRFYRDNIFHVFFVVQNDWNSIAVLAARYNEMKSNIHIEAGVDCHCNVAKSQEWQSSSFIATRNNQCCQTINNFFLCSTRCEARNDKSMAKYLIIKHAAWFH